MLYLHPKFEKLCIKIGKCANSYTLNHCFTDDYFIKNRFPYKTLEDSWKRT